MRPHGRAQVDPNNPRGFGMCDRCGFWFQLDQLQWQFEWSGQSLYNKRILVCTGVNCLDIPQEQLRTIVLPQDPVPLLNARVPYFEYEEQTNRITQYGYKNPPWGAGPQMIRCLQNGEVPRILEYNTSS